MTNIAPTSEQIGANEPSNRIFSSKWGDKTLFKRAISLFIFMFVLTMFLTWEAASNFGYLILRASNYEVGAFIFGTMFLMILGWFVFLQVWHKVKHGSFFWFMDTQHPWKKVILLGTLLSGFLLGSSMLASSFMAKGPSDGAEQMNGLILSMPLAALIFMPFFGMCEELFFRGVIQKYVGLKIGVIGGVLTGSFLFTLTHGFQYSIPLLIQVFIAGTALGTTYAYFKDIRINMLAHFINNFVGVLFVILTMKSTAGFFPDGNVLTQIASKGDLNSEYAILYSGDYSFNKNCSSGTGSKIQDAIADKAEMERLMVANCNVKSLNADLNDEYAKVEQISKAQTQGSTINADWLLPMLSEYKDVSRSILQKGVEK